MNVKYDKQESKLRRVLMMLLGEELCDDQVDYVERPPQVFPYTG